MNSAARADERSLSDSDAALRRALAALRREYLDEAPRRLSEMWSAFARAGQGDRAALADLETLFHRLAGTGGAYGLPAVTDAARGGEVAVHDVLAVAGPPDAAALSALRDHIQNVADAFASTPGPE